MRVSIGWVSTKGRVRFWRALQWSQSFKAKYGHCDVVSQCGEDASLGQEWCIGLRVTYKKMQNNQMPANKLSDGQIQRLNDAGFKWCSLKREITSMKTEIGLLFQIFQFHNKYIQIYYVAWYDFIFLIESEHWFIWLLRVSGISIFLLKGPKPLDIFFTAEKTTLL